jgi:hypothetical protein
MNRRSIARAAYRQRSRADGVILWSLTWLVRGQVDELSSTGGFFRPYRPLLGLLVRRLVATDV